MDRPLLYSVPTAYLKLYADKTNSIYRTRATALTGAFVLLPGDSPEEDGQAFSFVIMCPSGKSLRNKQAADLRPAFEVLDADRDGKISTDDLRTFYAGIPGARGDGEDDLVGTMISVADSNKDGFVEYEEFERVLDGVRESSRARRNGAGAVGSAMEDAFRVMDKDGDGRLSREDLRSFMELAGLAVNEEEITAMIRLGGGDGAGGVTYEGLLKILAVDDVV